MSSDEPGTREQFLAPERFVGRNEVLSKSTSVPKAAGVYGWWFQTLPFELEVSRCCTRSGLTLLYTGISPGEPPKNSKKPSAQTLRSRIWTHYAGNAEGSTLRKTLGCLLADKLGLELRRVGSGNRMTFGEGEQILSRWMQSHALVSWVTHPEPWELEREIIAAVDLPLNLQGNRCHAFHPVLSKIRAAAVARARALPVLPNPGVGGR